MEMKVTKDELIQILKSVETSQFVNVTTETLPRMNVKGNPFYGKIIKRMTCNYLIGNEYEKRVRTNESKEGLEPDFVTGELKGKRHVSKCVLVDTKTESVHYLMVERFDEIKPKIELIDIDTKENPFTDDEVGHRLYESYKSFLVKSTENKSQEQERKVMVITPKIDNIKEISLNGNHYIVTE